MATIEIEENSILKTLAVLEKARKGFLEGDPGDFGFAEPLRREIERLRGLLISGDGGEYYESLFNLEDARRHLLETQMVSRQRMVQLRDAAVPPCHYGMTIHEDHFRECERRSDDALRAVYAASGDLARCQAVYNALHY